MISSAISKSSCTPRPLQGAPASTKGAVLFDVVSFHIFAMKKVTILLLLALFSVSVLYMPLCGLTTGLRLEAWDDLHNPSEAQRPFAPDVRHIDFPF